MRRLDFLKRLHKEAALQLVAPSDEMKSAYLKKAESNLISARLLLDNDLFEQSVSMAYYSMYYSVLALFFATGIKCENHTVASWFLADVFGIESTDLESARKERLDKEYYVLAAPVRPEVEARIKTAESFNAVLLDKIERLTQQEIENYRIRFEKLLE